jgi:glycerol-3-phosphate cytidylyltransferase
MATFIQDLKGLKGLKGLKDLKGKVIGVALSCWDLMHAGHHLILADAKKQCDYLCVGLQTDPTLDRPEKNKPVQSLAEREIQVQGCRYIDAYFIYSTEASLYQALVDLNPDIRFLGDDYLNKKFTGDDLPAKIIYHPRSVHNYSTTALRKKIKEGI